MRTIITEDCSSRIANIRTIVAPERIDHYNDLADFKLLLSAPAMEPIVVHFQIDVKVPSIIDKKEAEKVSERLFYEIISHISSRQFIQAFGGEYSISKVEVAKRQQTSKLRANLARMLRYNNATSAIKAMRGMAGACIFDLRLPRGISIRAIHKSLTTDIETMERAQTGTMTLAGSEYAMYLWRPNAIIMRNVPLDVTRMEIEMELQRSFPFVSLSGFDVKFIIGDESAYGDLGDD